MSDLGQNTVASDSFIRAPHSLDLASEFATLDANAPKGPTPHPKDTHFSQLTSTDLTDPIKELAALEKKNGVDGIHSRPQLPPPEEIDTATLTAFSQELERLQQDIKEGNEGSVATLRMFLLTMKQRIAQSDAFASLTLVALGTLEEDNRNLRPKYLELMKNQQSLISEGKLVTWTGEVMQGVTVGALLAALVTEGRQAIHIIALIGGLGQGSSTIVKGALDYELSKGVGEMEMIQFTRRENEQLMGSLMNELRTSRETVLESIRELTDVAKGWYECGRINLR